MHWSRRSEADVERWIEHFCEPRRLILSWRAPEDAKPDRHRWAIGELTRDGGQSMFRYFDDREFSDANVGRTISALIAAGFLGYPAFTYAPGQVFTDEVLEAFQRRLPPRSRADFPRYLEHFRIRGDSSVSTFALLGLTEAKLPSDGFALVDPLDPEASDCEVVLEVAGHRHYRDAVGALKVGQAVELVADPGNSHDANAVRLEVGGQMIGHVSRFQAPTIGVWLKSRRLEAWLLRLNGSTASPRAFVFLQMRSGIERVAA
jgi:hypothetical protein